MDLVDVSSTQIATEIQWLQSEHERTPPQSKISAISLYYSKLNDRNDSFVSRIHNVDRTSRQRFRDFFRHIVGACINIGRILGIGIYHSFRGYRIIRRSSSKCEIRIDYVGAGMKPIVSSSISVPKDEMEIVFHSIDPEALPNKLLREYGFFDTISFVYLLVRISISTPFVPGHLFESLVEKTRELTNTYLFQFYLVATYLENCTGKITMLYEDQPRDRMLLFMLSSKFNIVGFIHSPALNFYRYNLIYSAADLMLPDEVVCLYKIKAKNLLKYKKLDSRSCEVEPVESCIHPENIQFEEIVICLPNNTQLIQELSDFAKSLSSKYSCNVFLNPHPLTQADSLENVVNLISSENHLTNRTLVISSFMTNKGYYLMEEGYSVIYVGSDVLPWYNPFPGSDVIFARRPIDVCNILVGKK